VKKTFVLVAFITTSLQGIFAQDSSRQANLSQLLSAYYNIQNALVAGNAGNATAAAAVFLKVASGIDNSIISEDNLRALVKDAEKFSATNDINKQRPFFASFSLSMAALAKAVKLTDKPVYQAYCPMKKAYWLSSEKEIRNPYYGNAMLTCGQVTETL
jgi:hypothetical protein